MSTADLLLKSSLVVLIACNATRISSHSLSLKIFAIIIVIDFITKLFRCECFVFYFQFHTFQLIEITEDGHSDCLKPNIKLAFCSGSFELFTSFARNSHFRRLGASLCVAKINIFHIYGSIANAM